MHVEIKFSQWEIIEIFIMLTHITFSQYVLHYGLLEVLNINNVFMHLEINFSQWEIIGKVLIAKSFHNVVIYSF